MASREIDTQPLGVEESPRRCEGAFTRPKIVRTIATLAQLAASRAMLMRERETLGRLQGEAHLAKDVRAILVYVDGEGVEFVEMDDAYWKDKGEQLLAELS